jgi:hypothetical protein
VEADFGVGVVEGGEEGSADLPRCDLPKDEGSCAAQFDDRFSVEQCEQFLAGGVERHESWFLPGGKHVATTEFSIWGERRWFVEECRSPSLPLEVARRRQPLARIPP